SLSRALRFFFQAEDGIPDFHVTGVQTCALPILTGRPPISISLTISALAMVDLPDPDSPVKNTVKPCFARGGEVRRSSATTSGKRSEERRVGKEWRSGGTAAAGEQRSAPGEAGAA